MKLISYRTRLSSGCEGQEEQITTAQTLTRQVWATLHGFLYLSLLGFQGIELLGPTPAYTRSCLLLGKHDCRCSSASPDGMHWGGTHEARQC